MRKNVIVIIIIISNNNNNNNNTLFRYRNVFGIGRIALSPMLKCINLNHNYLLILLFNHLLKKIMEKSLEKIILHICENTGLTLILYVLKVKV